MPAQERTAVPSSPIDLPPLRLWRGGRIEEVRASRLDSVPAPRTATTLTTLPGRPTG